MPRTLGLVSLSRRSFLKRSSATGGAALLLDSASAEGKARLSGRRIKPVARQQIYPVSPTPSKQVGRIPPQYFRTEVGWAGGTFLFEEAKSATKHHGADLGVLGDPITSEIGAHYVFSHFDHPDIDPAAYRLTIGGNVAKPMTLTLGDLQSRLNVSETVLLECAGNGRTAAEPRPVQIPTPWFNQAFGVFEYVGTPLADLLNEAHVQPGSVEVVFTGVDQGVEQLIPQNYQKSLPLSKAFEPDVLVAWEANGQPLTKGHGAPVRLLVPGWYGTYSVKWLTGIEVVTKPFRGYQQFRSYRYTQTDPFIDPGRPVREMNVRAAMKPPGVPDVPSGARWLPAGPVTLVGKAWSGHGTITHVEVSTNDGETWSSAALGTPISPQSWTPWTFAWDARKGNHIVAVRATDSAGNRQPRHPKWNYLGVGINAYERSRVIVT